MSSSSNTMDSSTVLLLGLVTAFVVIFVLPNLIWPNFYTGIWMKIKLAELNLTTPLVDLLLPRGVSNKFYFYADRLDNLTAQEIKIAHILEVERLTFMVYGWIPFLYLAVASIRLLKTKPENTVRLNLESLLELQTRESFRFNRHLIKHNPLKDPRLDMERGLYKNRMQPLDYCKRKKIITLSPSTVNEDEMMYIFHPETCKKVLLDSLGATYTGLHSLLREEKWMLAAFLIFLSGDSAGYHDLLGDISTSIAEMNEKDIEKGLEKVDKKTIETIEKFSKDNESSRLCKSIIKNDSIGENPNKLIYSLINAFKTQLKVETNKVLNPLLKAYPTELAFINTGVFLDGDPYESVTFLEFYQKAALAVVITAANKGEDFALKLANEISETQKMEATSEREEKIEQLDVLLEITLISSVSSTPAEIFNKATESHNYTHGVLLKIYRESGNIGIICASRFTWLKLYNRPLYFTLLDEGMPEHSIEVSATRTHFNAEIEAGRKLKEPEIDHQVETIKLRLLEQIDIE